MTTRKMFKSVDKPVVNVDKRRLFFLKEFLLGNVKNG